MTQVCFNGCSFTEGLGFDVKDRDQYIYDRLVAKHFKWSHDNIAIQGSSNQTIFLRSADAICNKHYNVVFTQWTALNRQWFYPGPDCEYSITDEKFPEFKYRDIHLDKNFNKKFKDTLRLFNHDYHKIIELISFVNILNNLGKVHNTRIVHINGLVPWQSDLLLLDNNNNLSTHLSNYTKTILDFDNRDDFEIVSFFNKLQFEFSKLNEKNWVNLFDSFQQNLIDQGPLGHHPGIESHRWMADNVINFMENEL